MLTAARLLVVEHEVELSLLRRIRGEFAEMPDLRVTTNQARRLWGVDEQVCGAALAALVGTGFLTTTRSGSFIRRR